VSGDDPLCPVNIGRCERRKRLVAGVVVLALGLLAAAVLIAGRTGPAALRAVLVIPFFIGFLALNQAAAGT
jgi:hypothetical protein